MCGDVVADASYAPSVHTLDGLEILSLPLCCHCAVAVCGDVLAAFAVTVLSPYVAMCR